MQPQRITTVPNGLHQLDPNQLLHPECTNIVVQRAQDGHNWQVQARRPAYEVADLSGTEDAFVLVPIAAVAAQQDAQVLASALECCLIAREAEEAAYLVHSNAERGLGRAHYPNGDLVFFDLDSGTVIGHELHHGDTKLQADLGGLPPIETIFRLELAEMFEVYGARARDMMKNGLSLEAFGYWADGRFWPARIVPAGQHGPQ